MESQPCVVSAVASSKNSTLLGACRFFRPLVLGLGSHLSDSEAILCFFIFFSG